MQVGNVALFLVLLLVSLLVYIEVPKYQTENKRKYTATGNTACGDTNNSKEAGYIFTCENIDRIKIVRFLGSGIFKRTYLGEYESGTKVAIKMLNNDTNRLDKLKNAFMKEILLLQQLRHPNIIQLLGFCIRTNPHGTGSLIDEGLIAVLEYGDEVDMDFLMHLPLFQRLDIALDVVDLLMYLEQSPLGPLRMKDVRLRHFLFHEETLKIIDVDGVSEEPSCQDDKTKRSEQRNKTTVSENRVNNPCQFGRCVESRCMGYNAKFNLLKLIEILLHHLVTVADITRLKREISGLEAPQHHAVRSLEKLIVLMRNKHNVTSTGVRQLLSDSRSMLQ